MLTFNDLLTLQGVDPAQVRLVRHQDRRLRAGRHYEAWRSDRAAFEAYQSAQMRDVFPNDAVLASFIVTDARKTVFAGMYRVDSVGSCPPGTTDALLNSDVSGQFMYHLQLLDVLSDYRDKLAIEWGPGTRVWVQRAAGSGQRTRPSRLSRSPSSTSRSFQASVVSFGSSTTSPRCPADGSKCSAAPRVSTSSST